MITTKPAVASAELLQFLRSKRLSLIPLRRDKKPACGCGYTAFADRLASDEEFDRLFSDPTYNLGVMLGAASGGLVARDFDNLVSYARWAREFPDAAKRLPTVATGRAEGGRHVYARTDLSVFARLVDGKASVLWDDKGHTKGPPGFMVFPPSRHLSGRIYEWLVPPTWETPEPFPFVADVSEIGFIPPSFTQAVSLSSGVFKVERGTKSPERKSVPPQVSQTNPGSFAKLTPPVCPPILSPAADKFVVPDDEVEFSLWAVPPTVPQRYGERNRGLFRLARRLLKHPRPETLTDEYLANKLRWWLDLGAKTIWTHDWDENWKDFELALQNARIPCGWIVAEAAERCRNSGELTVLRLCRELHDLRNGREFFLGCRLAGKLIGKSHTYASRELARLCRGGVLQRLSEGKYGRKIRLAATYRYIPASQRPSSHDRSNSSPTPDPLGRP